MKYLYIIMGLAFLGSGAIGASEELLRMGLAFAGLLVGWQGVRQWRKESPPPALDWQHAGEIAKERVELLQESYEKAVADCAYIEESRRQIGDVGLSRQLGKMQQVAGNMLHYLEKNPQKIPLAQRFIDYYQDRAVLLVKEYREIEATNLQTAQVQEMKKRMKEALDGLDEAYEEQFGRLLSDQFIDLDAEIKVMQQTMSSEGIQRTADAKEERAATGDNAPGLEGMLNRLQSAILGKNNRSVKDGTGSGFRGVHVEHGNRGYSMIPEEQKGDVLLTKVIQSALAIVLGSFGAHKFYQGKTFQGVLYCMFFWTLLPGVIGFCEGIRYLSMKMDDFYEDYYIDRLKG